VLRRSLGLCETFAARRPEFIANIRLLLRLMAAQPDFRRDACAQIEAWSPVCADDWISCISTVISWHRNAGPVASARDGALRMFWQSLLQETNRIAVMRDPGPLPPGAWSRGERSLETETALMLRQTVDTLMKERFGLQTTRHVPQLHANQSAVSATEARAAVAAMVEREQQAGFPLACQFARDSAEWKTFVGALPEVRTALALAVESSLAALDHCPQDEVAIQCACTAQADAIRAAPLRDALEALFRS